jgi:hypothetical protein
MAAGSGQSPTAVVVWDGIDYSPDDLTGLFAAAAQTRGMRVLHVSTLE